MAGSYEASATRPERWLNAVALQNAVLCAECEVVSDSPHDQCLVCGSRSLVNICRMFGGNLPKERASLIRTETVNATSREVLVLYLTRPRVKIDCSDGL